MAVVFRPFQLRPFLAAGKKIPGLLILILALTLSNKTFAMHVKGGYIQYIYNGAGSTSGTSSYTITVTSTDAAPGWKNRPRPPGALLS